MNKKEKEIAAIYISSCLNDMRLADIYNDPGAKEKAVEDYKKYRAKIKNILEMKFELFCTDYEKEVMKPMQEINKIAMVFYSQRVNGERLHYPA